MADFLSMVHEKAQFRSETCTHSISLTDMGKVLLHMDAA
jgi:hypothetical protein